MFLISCFPFVESNWRFGILLGSIWVLDGHGLVTAFADVFYTFVRVEQEG